MNDKLIKWVENCFENKVNNQPIFINNHNLNFIHKSLGITINFIDLKFPIKDSNRKYSNSIINITNTNTQNYQNFKKSNIREGFIFVRDKKSIENLIFAIQTKNMDKVKEVEYINIEPTNLETLLKYNKDDFKNLIIYRENILKTINEQYNKLEDEDLSYFLEVYTCKNILIASFAQRLYRLATLDFISSEKKIGGLISSILCSSSQVVNYKYIGVNNVPVKKIRNTRIYDLNINKNEMKIKTNIARKLIKLNLKELDLKKISQITELHIKNVENLYKREFLG